MDEAKIEVDHYYDRRLIWNEPEDRKDFYKTAVAKNTLLDEADLGRIRKFCTEPIWPKDRWWEYIYTHENNIVLTKRREAENRKYERRQRALKDRAEHTGPLPEQLILDRAERLYFRERHYLYYKSVDAAPRSHAVNAGVSRTSDGKRDLLRIPV